MLQMVIASLGLASLCLVSSFRPVGAEEQKIAVVRSDWRLGFYIGALSHQSLPDILVLNPFRTKLENDYVADVHGIYTFHRFANLPLELEIEGGIAKRFSQSHEWEFDLIPVARWKQFPWNDFLYTNVRVGLFGVSYTTGISDWEKLNTSNHTGSRFLNFIITEFTFAPSKTSPFESFIRVHHRSGVYGLINGVYGGSNYIAAGARFSLP